MCLFATTTCIDKKAEGYGWKAYEFNSVGNLRTPYCRIPARRGAWKSSRAIGPYRAGARYPLGHHIFDRAWAAKTSAYWEDEIALPVRWRHRLATGSFAGDPCTVARHIYVPTDEELTQEPWATMMKELENAKYDVQKRDKAQAV